VAVQRECALGGGGGRRGTSPGQPGEGSSAIALTTLTELDVRRFSGTRHADTNESLARKTKARYPDRIRSVVAIDTTLKLFVLKWLDYHRTYSIAGKDISLFLTFNRGSAGSLGTRLFGFHPNPGALVFYLSIGSAITALFTVLIKERSVDFGIKVASILAASAAPVVTDNPFYHPKESNQKEQVR
jgi:lipoprotein signal peptidase